MKERWLLRRHIFRATFSTSRNFNFAPYEQIPRITKDIHAETSFSGYIYIYTRSSSSPACAGLRLCCRKHWARHVRCAMAICHVAEMSFCLPNAHRASKLSNISINLNEGCVKISLLYLAYFPRNKPSKSVTVVTV